MSKVQRYQTGSLLEQGQITSLRKRHFCMCVEIKKARKNIYSAGKAI